MWKTLNVAESKSSDVFVLLVDYYTDKILTATLIMEPTRLGRLSVNIGSTSEVLPHISFQLMH